MALAKAQEEIQIPEEVQIEIQGTEIKVSGPKGETSKTLDLRGISFSKEDDVFVIESESTRRKRRAALGTAKSHVQNMIEAVTEGFVYKLKVVYSHFPISVEVNGDFFEIHNFIGEEEPRKARILGDTEVEIDGDEISVKGTDKEDVGQTAANIEQASQVKGRDPRVFQDGVYVVEEP
ncbi:MAG: 50S ribosomal protein L6 [Hadesarchaea archaeon]|nr:50S ribosomal protein L6 [Hadesarchaea archaeon]